jgi:hypothetical protein
MKIIAKGNVLINDVKNSAKPRSTINELNKSEYPNEYFNIEVEESRVKLDLCTNKITKNDIITPKI